MTRSRLRTRRNSPAPSQAAADMLERTGRAKKKYFRVHALLSERPMTDFETTDAYIGKYGELRRGTEHSIATTRKLLEKDGLVIPTTLQRPHPASKILCTVWKAAHVEPPFQVQPWKIVDAVAAMQAGDPLDPELWALANRMIHEAEQRKKLHKRKKVV